MDYVETSDTAAQTDDNSDIQYRLKKETRKRKVTDDEHVEVVEVDHVEHVEIDHVEVVPDVMSVLNADENATPKSEEQNEQPLSDDNESLKLDDSAVTNEDVDNDNTSLALSEFEHVEIEHVEVVPDVLSSNPVHLLSESVCSAEQNATPTKSVEHNKQALSDDKADPFNPSNLINNENDKNTKNLPSIIATDVATHPNEETIDQTHTKLTRSPLSKETQSIERRSSIPETYDFKKYLNGWRSREQSLEESELIITEELDTSELVTSEQDNQTGFF